MAALAEARLVAGYWLRSGNSACVNGAAEFLRQTEEGLPAHVRIGLVLADNGRADLENRSQCMRAGWSRSHRSRS